MQSVLTEVPAHTALKLSCVYHDPRASLSYIYDEFLREGERWGSASSALFAAGRGATVAIADGERRVSAPTGLVNRSDGFTMEFAAENKRVRRRLVWAVWHQDASCSVLQGTTSLPLTSVDPANARVAYAEDFAGGRAIEVGEVIRSGEDLTLDVTTRALTYYYFAGWPARVDDSTYELREPGRALQSNTSGFSAINADPGTRQFGYSGKQVATGWPLLTVVELPLPSI